jgi:glycosyltransferase involved in cell wall biosynthesis
MKFSVLLSIYHKESPTLFKKALISIIDQTKRPNEIVIVKDGPLTKELDKVIYDFNIKYPNIIKIIKLENNQGLGKALSIGIKQCSYNIIARMDTDDISKNKRFEKQLNILKESPDIDIVGSWVEEFENNSENILSIRKVPQYNNEIIKFAKKRCPFNHPSVMFRKSSVLEAGNYKPFYLNEDYYLWLRMLREGCKGYNIQESLLFFRIDDDTFKRRGGLKYAMQDIKLQNILLKLKFINRLEYIKNVLTKPLVRLMPNYIRKLIYKKLLR